MRNYERRQSGPRATLVKPLVIEKPCGNRGKIGSANGNWKNAGWHVCIRCSTAFHSYVKTRRFCTFACYAASEEKRVNAIKANFKVRKLKLCAEPSCISRAKLNCSFCSEHNPRLRGPRVLKCRTCDTMLEQKPKRFYCLPCRAAGKHRKPPRLSKCAMCSEEVPYSRKYCDVCVKMVFGYRRGLPRKRDANHQEIVDALIAAGCSVADLSAQGGGTPDIAVGLAGENHLFEIKNPATRGKLNPSQEDWHARWKGQVSIVTTPEEALAAIGIRSDP